MVVNMGLTNEREEELHHSLHHSLIGQFHKDYPDIVLNYAQHNY